jgi:hypothetical protein
VASSLPHFLNNRLTDGGEVVSLTGRPPFTPQEDSWYSFLLDADSTPGPYLQLEGLGQFKNLMTSSRIEPASFRLVAQSLNELRYRVPQYEFALTLIY